MTVSNKIDRTVADFQQGSSCAQAVLATFLPDEGVPEGLAHQMGASLGGGLAGRQEICGALNAGVIVLSARHGNEHPGDKDSKERSISESKKLISGFESTFGSIKCVDLVGDTSTEAGKARAEQANIYRQVCDRCVEFVARQLLVEE